MTQVALDPNRQTLIEAYLALNLDCGASSLAIRSRYEELQARTIVRDLLPGELAGPQAGIRAPRAGGGRLWADSPGTA